MHPAVEVRRLSSGREIFSCLVSPTTPPSLASLSAAITSSSEAGAAVDARDGNKDSSQPRFGIAGQTPSGGFWMTMRGEFEARLAGWLAGELLGIVVALTMVDL